MKIRVEVEVAPEEVPMATELLAVLRCVGEGPCIAAWAWGAPGAAIAPHVCPMACRAGWPP